MCLEEDSAIVFVAFAIVHLGVHMSPSQGLSRRSGSTKIKAITTSTTRTAAAKNTNKSNEHNNKVKNNSIHNNNNNKNNNNNINIAIIHLSTKSQQPQQKQHNHPKDTLKNRISTRKTVDWELVFRKTNVDCCLTCNIPPTPINKTRYVIYCIPKSSETPISMAFLRDGPGS